MIGTMLLVGGALCELLAIVWLALALRAARAEAADYRERMEHWRRKDIERLKQFGEAMDRARVAEDALGEVLRRSAQCAGSSNRRGCDCMAIKEQR